jgi:predicted enzyme related to lactoylglutathione lyase
MKAALEAGATVALPKMAIPNVGHVAYLVDPEGNIFGVFQDDPKA